MQKESVSIFDFLLNKGNQILLSFEESDERGWFIISLDFSNIADKFMIMDHIDQLFRLAVDYLDFSSLFNLLVLDLLDQFIVAHELWFFSYILSTLLLVWLTFWLFGLLLRLVFGLIL